MGLLITQWNAKHEGKAITVRRDEVTRGFVVYYGDQEVAKKSWSVVGTGEVEGTVRAQGRERQVRVKLGFPAKCFIWVDGEPLEVSKG